MSELINNITKYNFENWQPELAKRLLNNFDSEQNNLLDALHLCQDTFGYIDKELIPILAKTFNLSRAEVYGVVSFYHDFRDQKPGAYVLKICQAESCQAMGSDHLTAALKESLNIDFHETNSAADITLEPVYCLGNCSCSPNLMINSKILSRLTSDKLKQLVQEIKAKQDG